jgi:nucleoside-diphosphate-sugar epimerase
MKLLVTGGTGFIGSHTVKALCDAGHDVVMLARSEEKARRVAQSFEAKICDVIVGDMADEGLCREALSGCQGVLHMAASVEIGRADDVQAVNGAGNQNVLGAAVEMGLDPVVYTSSVAALFPPQGPVIRADDPIGELESAYGRSKTDGERAIRAMQAEGAPLVSVYPAGVYGPDDPGLGAGAKGLRDRLRFGCVLTSGGTSCVDVRDIAAILCALAVPNGGRGHRRYMAGGHFLSWAEEADLFDELTGRKVRRIPASRRLVNAAGHTVDFIKRLIPSFDYPLTREAARYVTDFVPCDSRIVEQELRIEFRPSRETLGDAIRWLVRAGHMAPKWAGRLGEEATEVDRAS